jgi:hypothetical protein
MFKGEILYVLSKKRDREQTTAVPDGVKIVGRSDDPARDQDFSVIRWAPRERRRADVARESYSPEGAGGRRESRSRQLAGRNRGVRWANRGKIAG